MKKILLIIGIIVCNFCAFSQESIDTLKIKEEIRLQSSLGEKYFGEENYQSAIECFVKAKDAIKTVYGEKNKQYATALNNIGYIYSTIGNVSEGLKFMDESLEIQKEIDGENYFSIATTQLNLATINSNIGNYEKALEYYQAARKLSEHFQDLNTELTIIIGMGQVYKAMGNYSEALPYFSTLAEKTKELVGENTSVYAVSVNNVGDLHFKLGDYKKAGEYFEKAIEIHKTAGGEKTLDYANILNNYASVHSKKGDLDNALKYYSEALKIITEISGDENLETAQTLNNIALVYYKKGNYKSSIDVYHESIAILKMLGLTSNELYATALHNIATSYCDYGDYSSAFNALLMALEIQNGNFGENSKEVAAIYDLFGQIYSKIDLPEIALNFSKKAIEIREKVFDGNHELIATSYNNIGVNYADLGDYKNALKYYNSALEMNIALFGENHSSCATTLNNMSAVNAKMGDYKNALKNCSEAIRIIKEIYGEAHPDYIRQLINMAEIYTNMKEYKSALECCNKATVAYKEIINENNLSLYTDILQNAGYVLIYMGEYEKALLYQNEALGIIEEEFGNEHTKYALGLNNIAFANLKMKNYNQAKTKFEESLIIFKEIFGKTHPNTITAIRNLGTTYFCLKDYKTATQLHNFSLRYSKQNLISNFRFLTAYEREQYWNKNQKYFANILRDCNKLPTDTTATKASYNAELITKGLLLTSEIEFSKIIMESGDSALLQDFEEMKLLRLQLDKQYEKPISERTLNCDSLENIADKLEKKLIENCKEYGDFTKSIALEWTDVQNALAKNDLAIEFTSFKIDEDNDTTMYAAFVLDKNMEAPQMIPLFTNFELDKAMQNPSIEKTKEETSDDERGAIMMTMKSKSKGIYETSALYNLIWQPLENHLNNSERVFFAPSGKLYQIAIEYLPIDESTNISDKYELYRVSSTKNLAMDYVPKPYQSSTLYGGINYDTDSVQMKEASERYSTRLAERGNSRSAYTITDSTRSVRNSLAYLPGTKAEVQTIQKQLAKKKIDVSLYEGNLGNEESFKALSGTKNEILHVATHGFFLEEDEENKTTNSLDRAGLLLSGANLAWTEQPLPEGVEDGILTAREISYLDFRGVDLLVLSACQTALGEVTGEGVFGLQRGFKKAGVKSIVMSLWSVDDAATQLMMTEFYKNLTKGKTKRESFLAAQKTVKTTKGFEKPYYWAAFVLLDGE